MKAVVGHTRRHGHLVLPGVLRVQWPDVGADAARLLYAGEGRRAHNKVENRAGRLRHVLLCKAETERDTARGALESPVHPGLVDRASAQHALLRLHRAAGRGRLPAGDHARLDQTLERGVLGQHVDPGGGEQQRHARGDGHLHAAERAQCLAGGLHHALRVHPHRRVVRQVGVVGTVVGGRLLQRQIAQAPHQPRLEVGTGVPVLSTYLLGGHVGAEINTHTIFKAGRCAKRRHCKQ
mmetsp:Transcript_16824/g.42967  ORF Transcript_16824/g.42967 Transcript_16824/m.42967 type:complete len:237 (-) Transcript_16824:212-922(-)